MKHTKFTSLLLVLAMTLSLVVLSVMPATAEGASDTWDGAADTAFAGGTGTDADPFRIATAEQLALLAKLTNEATFFYTVDGEEKNSNLPILTSVEVYKGIEAEGNFSYSYYLYTLNGQLYVTIDNGESILAYPATVTTATWYSTTISGNTFYMAAVPGNNKTAPAYAYDAATMSVVTLEGVTIKNSWNSAGNRLTATGVSGYDLASNAKTLSTDVVTYTDAEGVEHTVSLVPSSAVFNYAAMDIRTFEENGIKYGFLTAASKAMKAGTAVSVTSETDETSGIMTITSGTSKLNITPYSDLSYVLTADLVLNQGTVKDGTLVADDEEATIKEWAPIGINGKAAFSGKLDGDGHTVSGIYVKSTATKDQTDLQYIGLFGYAVDAHFVNAKLAESEIRLSFNQNTKSPLIRPAAAMLVGYLISDADVSIVDHVSVLSGYVYAASSGAKYTTDPSAGAVVGHAKGAVSISNCTNAAEIKGYHGSNSSTNGDGYVFRAGGIVGYMQGSSLDASVVSDCTNYGYVHGTNSRGDKDPAVGGIVGEANTCTIRGCSNTGKVMADSTSQVHVGGVVGFLKAAAALSDCTNTGYVYGKMAGGIIGNIDLETESNTVSGCANFGLVEATSQAGGIVGMAYADRAILTVTDLVNYGTVKGLKAGGILGEASSTASNTVQYVQVFDSVNYGTVIGTVESNGCYAGGIVGHAQKDAKISGVTNYGTVSGTYVAGGIVGLMNNYSKSPLKIENSASIANVTASGVVVENVRYAYVGGIAGQLATGNLSNNNAVGKVSVAPYAGSAAYESEVLYTGGIVGYMTATAGVVSVTYCVSEAVLSGATEAGALFGGIVAAATSTTAANCFGVGDPVGAAAATEYASIASAVTALTDAASRRAAVETINSLQQTVVWSYGAPTVSAASVTLGDYVAISLYAQKAMTSRAITSVTADGQKLSLKDSTVNGTDYVQVVISDIEAADLVKDFAIVTSTDSGVQTSLSYGVSKYIDRMSGKGNDKLDALLAALSDYAKAAAGEDVDVDEAYAAVELVPVANVDATYVSAIALDLTDSIRPIIKVADGVAQVTVAIYGETYTYAVVDGEVIIDCLTATSLNNEMVLSFLDAEGNELGTTRYAVSNYIKSVEDLDLAKALAVYMQAARAYNGLD